MRIHIAIQVAHIAWLSRCAFRASDNKEDKMNSMIENLIAVKKITVAGAAILALSVLQIGCEGTVASTAASEEKATVKTENKNHDGETVAPCVKWGGNTFLMGCR